MGRIIEGFWDCKYCGTTGIRGGIRECLNCGKARDEDTVFYMNKKHISYVPEEKAKHISRNPDWLCQYCGQLNSDNDNICISCGSARTEENLNYFENRRKKEEEEQQKKLEKFQYSSNSLKDSYYYNSEDTKTRRNNNNIKEKFSSLIEFFSDNIKTILIILVAILGILGLVFLFIPKEQELTIQEMYWERCIDIERYQTVEESGWDLPANARLQYSREEFSHYADVPDHYETRFRKVPKERTVGYEDYVVDHRNLGNGYFEEITDTKPITEIYYEEEPYQELIYRQEPVYRTKYYYEIDKWLYERSIKTNGSDKNPYWGEYKLNSDERVSSETEHFTIVGINSKNKVKNVELSFDDWNSLQIGDTKTFKITLGYGKIVE